MDGGDSDQFLVLEQKIDGLIGLARKLKKENDSFTERFQIQEEKLADLTQQVETLKAARDMARQKIVSLLEKMEQIGI